jgi:3-oxoacyl-[acyl-carrier protein] reductase
MRLADQVAIVTGGARGIGRAVCLGYARAGAKVVIADILIEAGRKIEEFINASGGESLFCECDVSNEAQVNHLIETSVNRFSGIDILVNNAGVDPRQFWHEVTGEQWDLVLDINLKSQFLCAQAVFPHMKSKGKGKIINVASVVHFLGFQDLIHYSASKGGVIGFTRALAREVGKHHINVNCIAPGAVKTEKEIEEFPDQEALAAILAEKQCIPDRIMPEDLIGTFIFLASTDSDPITGQTILVDGGWALN